MSWGLKIGIDIKECIEILKQQAKFTKIVFKKKTNLIKPIFLNIISVFPLRQTPPFAPRSRTCSRVEEWA